MRKKAALIFFGLHAMPCAPPARPSPPRPPMADLPAAPRLPHLEAVHGPRARGNMGVRERRQLFHTVRMQPLAADTFFPRLGVTFGEFAVWHTLSETRRKSRKRDDAERRANDASLIYADAASTSEEEEAEPAPASPRGASTGAG